MKKKIMFFWGCFFILMGTSAVYANGTSEAATGKPKTLTVWMKKQFVDAQNAEFENRVKEFARARNIDVNVELIAYEDFFPKWTAGIQSKNVPDLCFFGYQEIGQFYQQNLLEDLTVKLNELQRKNGNMYKNSIDVVTFNGKSYGIPLWGEGSVLYYRKDMLKKAGYDHPPRTWNEFKEIARAVTDPGKGIYGAGIGYGEGNSDAEFLTRSIFFSFGGSIFDENNKVKMNTENNIAATAFILSLFNEGLTPPGAVGWNDGGNNAAYISGQAAMVVNTGSIANALNGKPDLKNNTGISVLPAGPAGRYTTGIANYMGIFKDARNKELARELIDYLYDPAWYGKWIEIGAPLDLPVYEKMAQNDIWKNEFYKPIIDSMQTFKYLGYKGDYTPYAGKIYNMRLINTMFESLIINKDPSAAAIKKALDYFEVSAENLSQ
jgi:multiple sugar transport system substrate-binding protein